MAIILLNPDDGATIRDVVYQGIQYFSEGTGFQPGTLFKFEDDKTAEFFKNTFEFLQELQPEDAKKFMAMERLKCEKCDFQTRVKSQLEAHKNSHAKERELDELGIPVVKKQETDRSRFADATNSDIQKQIERQESNFSDGYPGLTEGEGLRSDKPRKSVVMS